MMDNQRNDDDYFAMPEVDEAMDYLARRRQKSQVSKAISVNSTLPAALNICPTVWINAMCQQFGLSKEGKKQEKIQRIVEYLADTKRLSSVIEKLTGDSKNVLGFVMRHDGWVEIEKLQGCGNVIDDGWFWVDEPPETPLGRLRVRALLFIGRAKVSGEDYTVAVVPKELRQPLIEIFSS